nr:VanZ family protein [Actinomyces sp.]
MSRHQTRILQGLTIVYLAIVLTATLWPSGDDVTEVKSVLVPLFISPQVKDVVLNLGMLVPLGFLASIAWPRTPWWGWALSLCVLSLTIELVQYLAPFLNRRGTVVNVIENSVGAWLGAAAAQLFRSTRASRRGPGSSPDPGPRPSSCAGGDSNPHER